MKMNISGIKMNKLCKYITIATIIFLYLPVVTLIGYSFNESKMVSIWGGFSLKWYKELMHNEAILYAFMRSLEVGLYSAVLATILGVAVSFHINYSSNKISRKIIQIITYIQFTVPEIIVGLSLILLYIFIFKIFGITDGMGIATIVIAHVAFSFPYVVVVVSSRISSINKQMIESAYDLGASKYVVFKDILFPNLFHSILSAFIMAFIISFDDFIIASFTSGAGVNTLPMLINSKIRLGITPEINALGSIIIFINCLFMCIRMLVNKYKGTKNARI